MTFEELLNVLILVYRDGTVVAIFNFHGKILLCDPQILYLKSFAEPTFDCSDVIVVFSGDKKIVNIEGDVDAFSFVVLMDPYARIRLGLFEIEIGENFGDEMEPRTG
jgi:hypothetical protein